MCPFFGISGFVLALYAVCRVRGREVWTCAGIAVALFVIALGRYTPLFEPLYHYAPGFNKFRGWSKFIYPAMLYVVMLSAIGLDAMLRRGIDSYVLGASLLGGAFFLTGAGFWAKWSAHEGAATHPQPWEDWLSFTRYSGESLNTVTEYFDPPYTQAAAKFAGTALWVAAASCLVLAVAFFVGRRWRSALFAVPVIALAELLNFALPTLVTFQYAPFRRLVVAEYLLSHPIGDGRLLDLEDQNTGMTTGENDLWGYDPGVSHRYAELFMRTQHIRPEDATQDLRFHWYPDIYATLLRCRYVFGFEEGEDHKILFRSFDPALVAPQVMLVPQVRVVAAGDAVLQAMDPPFDPRATVILENAPDPRPAARPAAGKVVVTARTTDSLTIEADLPDPQVLVVTDTYSDGWKARSLLPSGEGSGQTAYHVMPADHCVRAIPLAAGHHRLLLEYRPTAFLAGEWVSGISLLLYAAAVVRVVRARSRRQDPKNIA